MRVGVIVKTILSLIPIRKVLLFILSKLTGYAEDFLDEYYNEAFEKVMEAERKFLGAKRGEEKARYVKAYLREKYPRVKEYVMNLVIEMAVAYLHNLAARESK